VFSSYLQHLFNSTPPCYKLATYSSHTESAEQLRTINKFQMTITQLNN